MVDFTVFRGTKDGIKEEKVQRSVGPDEVVVKITHSGLCGTDAHYKAAGIVLGHEGVGLVEELGEKVTRFKKNDRVGWGYQHDSCGHCDKCLSKSEVYCPQRKLYGEANTDLGSMATHVVWKESFLHAIPDELAPEDAAPLQCGGATVFSVLRDYPVKPTDRVGIIGVGGLGHLAVQFASKMGCEVVVFSGSDHKRDEAMKLGANEFVATKGVKKLKEKVPVPLDVLIITTSSQPDWNLYFPILAPQAMVFPLSVDPENPLTVPYMPFLESGIRLQGSMVAGRATHREMLRFAAIHNIKPIVMKFPMTVDGITEAFETLEGGKMRYRGVLVA